MKSLFKGYMYAAFMLVASLFAACGEDEKEEIVIDESESTMEILSTETAFNFTSAGNVAKVLIFTTNRDWQIVRGEGDNSWLTIFERRGKAGEKIKVWVAAAENTGTDGRGASFTLQSDGHSELFTVYQAQKDALIISDPAAYKNLPADEQIIEVEFATNAGEYSVEYSFGTGATQWIEQVVEPVNKTRAMVTHKLQFKVLANEAYNMRNASININSKNTEAKATISVIQQGTIKPTVAIANKTAFEEVPYAETILPLQLETNVENLDDLEVVIAPHNQKWISCSKNEEGTAYELTVKGNTSSARSATIIVRSTKDEEIKDEVKVSQVTAPDVLITIKNKEALAKELNKLGDTFGIEYEALVNDWDVEISYADPDETGWVEETSRKLPGKVMFKVSENKAFKTRTATIRLYSKANGTVEDEVTIIQAATTCVVIPSGNTLEETLAAYGLTEKVESLELRGELGSVDWALLKTMANHTLKNLDLSAVTNTTLPNSAFMNCAKLETLLFPAHGKLEIIPMEVCQRCTALKAIRIPEGVVYVDHHAFAFCASLAEVWFSSTIKNLYGYSFEHTVITKIHCKTKPLQVFGVFFSKEDPGLATVFNSPDLPKRATLYVPSAYVDIYKNPTLGNMGWTEWPAGTNRDLFMWTDDKTAVYGEN